MEKFKLIFSIEPLMAPKKAKPNYFEQLKYVNLKLATITTPTLMMMHLQFHDKNIWEVISLIHKKKII